MTSFMNDALLRNTLLRLFKSTVRNLWTVLIIIGAKAEKKTIKRGEMRKTKGPFIKDVIIQGSLPKDYFTNKAFMTIISFVLMTNDKAV